MFLYLKKKKKKKRWWVSLKKLHLVLCFQLSLSLQPKNIFLPRARGTSAPKLHDHTPSHASKGWWICWHWLWFYSFQKWQSLSKIYIYIYTYYNVKLKLFWLLVDLIILCRISFWNLTILHLIILIYIF